jgi:hypothetical protein
MSMSELRKSGATGLLFAKLMTHWTTVLTGCEIDLVQREAGDRNIAEAFARRERAGREKHR